MTRKSLLKQWEDAIIKAAKAQGMRDWTFQAETATRLKSVHARIGEDAAQMHMGLNPYEARLILSEGHNPGFDLNALAAHEIAHAWTLHLGELCGFDIEGLCKKDGAFDRWMEAVCDKIAAITRE